MQNVYNIGRTNKRKRNANNQMEKANRRKNKKTL